MVRASVSTLPPGANGTTKRTGRVGYCCALAANAATAQQRRKGIRKRITRSLRLGMQPGCFYRHRPPRYLGAEVSSEFVRRAADRFGAFVRQAGLDVT